MLVLRTQNVIYENEEITASRFEIIGGKANSKKWKATVWACDEQLYPVLTMQEWLEKFKLEALHALLS